MEMRYSLLLVASLFLFSVGGCDLLGEDEDDDQADVPIDIGFTVNSADGDETAPALQPAAQQEYTITGNNGTLTITNLVAVVSDFELDNGEDAEFDDIAEAVDVPFHDSVATVVEDRAIPAGEYTQFQFEIDDLSTEGEDDDEDAAQIDSLRNQIEDLGFGLWPDSASVVVVGEFTPQNGGTPQTFTTYIAAEDDVDTNLNPPLSATGDETTGGVIVEIDPAEWFLTAEGDVVDLTGNDVIELEAALSDGITARAATADEFDNETAAARFGP